MNLQPNPPRMVTVGIALALARAFGYLCLFASPTVLVGGSLLPGI